MKDCFFAKSILLALLLAGTGRAGAQDPVPDTTDWRTYFPLEVGNEWQYKRREQLMGGGLGVVLKGWRVEGDTTVAGVDYFILRSCYFDEGQPVSCPDRKLIRYAPAHAMLVTSDAFTGEEWWWSAIPCRLDAPFDAPLVECTGPGTENTFFFTGGGYGQTAVVPPDTLRGVTLKAFASPVMYGYVLTAGIGLTEYDDELGPEPRRLIYARVGSREVGEPAFAFPTATEPPPDAAGSGLAVEVVPNPARGRAALVFRLRTPEAVAVTVFDPLGRRVHSTLPLRLGSGEQRIALDLNALVSGVYVVRLTAGSDVAVRKITVR